MKINQALIWDEAFLISWQLPPTAVSPLPQVTFIQQCFPLNLCCSDFFPPCKNEVISQMKMFNIVIKLVWAGF